jgi:hypothetical protein
MLELTTIAAGPVTVAKERLHDPVCARSASKRYTMESEREVHRATVESRADNAYRPDTGSSFLGGTIELF